MNNSQKIFDILPPQSEQKKPFQEKKSSIATQKLADEKKPKGSAGKKIFFIFLIILIAFVLVSQFILNKTEVLIYPIKENVSLSDKVKVDILSTKVDFASKIIPGKIFEEEKTFSQEFFAMGTTTEGKKAEGEITIYNNYSDVPQGLVVNTRFISSGGKLFKTTSRVTVPGGTYVKGKLQPGSVSIGVIADQPGEEYNIGPETFSIPGFAGTPKYTAFYGKSTTAMTGGFVGQIEQVTKADLDGAKKTLTDRAKAEAGDSLKNEISGDFVFSDDASVSEVISSTSSALLGDKVKSFTYRVQVKTKILVFMKADLENLSREWILSAALPEEKIKESSLQVFWQTDSVDFNTGKMTLDFDSSATVYSDVDTNDLANGLAGKSLTEAKLVLANLPQIDRAQIKSWPFWISRISQDNAKIEVKLILD